MHWSRVLRYVKETGVVARVYGRAGRSAFRQGNQLLLRTILPLAAAGLLTYAFFRTRGLLYSGWETAIGVAALGTIPWCVKETINLERAARRYYGGADGEYDVGAVLAQLPDEFHVFHGLGFYAGDVDHVVIGPTGVFVVETKNHTGTIALRDGRLCRNGTPLQQDFIHQAIAEAMYVKGKLRPGIPCHVRPVIVFARAQVRIRTAVEGVQVVPLGALTDIITGRSTSLTCNDVQIYVERLTQTANKIARRERFMDESGGFRRAPLSTAPTGNAGIEPAELSRAGRRASRYP